MNDRNTALIDRLKGLVALSRDPILLWSGGKDSTFLLQLMLRCKLKVSVLTFPHFWTSRQRDFISRMIEKHALTVFYYSPLNINYTDPHISADYAVGGVVVKVFMDHIAGTRCGIDVGQAAMEGASIQPGYLWDVTITGTKKGDAIPLVDEIKFKNEAGHRFVCPLWDWTDEEVLESVDQLKIEIDREALTSCDPEADTGNFVACMACIGADTVFCPKLGRMIQGV